MTLLKQTTIIIIIFIAINPIYISLLLLLLLLLGSHLHRLVQRSAVLLRVFVL